MINREASIIVTITAIMISIPVTFAPGGSGFISPRDDSPEVVMHRPVVPRLECWKGDGDVAVSGANIYTIWECYNHILFAKSNDAGKTFANTILMSTPNTNPKIHVLNDNVSISASGNNVAVMWDTNNTGISNPVLRTSSDGGNTFSNIVTLNSTPGGINKPAGSNMTGAAGNTTVGAGSNMTTGSNTTGGAHDSSIHTTKPAGNDPTVTMHLNVLSKKLTG
jgi:hypothetical protein